MPRSQPHFRTTLDGSAAIHDVLRVCDAIDDQSDGRGKSDLKRIVSMLTRLIQRTGGVSEGRIEYEYEYEVYFRQLSLSTPC